VSPVAVVVFVLAIGAVVALLFWWFSADQRAKRAMRGVPKRSIADVVEGERARIVGSVDVREPIYAPLSGRPCAYWRVTVEEKRSSGKNSYWRKIVDEHEGVDFFLTDGTGKAKIEVMHAQPVLAHDARGGSGFLNDPTPELESFLAERGHDTQGWIFNKTIRYREGVAEPGELVAVVGTGRWERDPDEKAQAGAGYREASMPQRLVMQAPRDGSPLLLSDEHDVLS